METQISQELLDGLTQIVQNNGTSDSMFVVAILIVLSFLSLSIFLVKHLLSKNEVYFDKIFILMQESFEDTRNSNAKAMQVVEENSKVILNNTEMLKSQMDNHKKLHKEIDDLALCLNELVKKSHDQHDRIFLKGLAIESKVEKIVDRTTYVDVKADKIIDKLTKE